MGGTSISGSRSRFWLPLALAVSAIASLYMYRIQGPWRYREDVIIRGVKSPMGDLYSPWVGTRELLLQHRNPYSPEVSSEIQQTFYGKNLHQDYTKPKDEIVDEQRFAYPVYVAFLLAPIVHLQFETALLATRIVLGLLLAISVVLWVDVLEWRIPLSIKLALILFVLSTPQTMYGFRLCQLALLTAFLVTAAFWCIARNHFISAGIFLAISTIKPQMVILVIAWLVLWSLRRWSERWRLTVSFVASMIALFMAGDMLLHGWIRSFYEGLIVYPIYAPTLISFLQLLFGDRFAEFCGAIAVTVLGVIAYRTARHPAQSRSFWFTSACVSLVTVIFLPLLPIFNQLLVLLPVFMVLQEWRSLPVSWRVLFSAGIAWPWLAHLLLLVLSPFIVLDKLVLAPGFPAIFVPPILLLILIAHPLFKRDSQVAPLTRTSDGCHTRVGTAAP